MVESGARRFSIERLAAVSKALDLPPTLLLRITVEETWSQEQIDSVFAGMFDTIIQLASLSDGTREHVIATIAKLYEREQQKTVASRKRA
jgi:hypothetical protein